jgi:hypothetical protein
MYGIPADGPAHPIMEQHGAAHAGSMKAMAGATTKAAGIDMIIMAMDTRTDITNRNAGA